MLIIEVYCLPSTRQDFLDKDDVLDKKPNMELIVPSNILNWDQKSGYYFT